MQEVFVVIQLMPSPEIQHLNAVPEYCSEISCLTSIVFQA